MAFSVTESTILSAVKGGSLTSILSSVLKPTYEISVAYISDGLNNGYGWSAGDVPFKPTSFIGVEVIEDASTSNAPVEKGKFTTYNKVISPGDLRVTFTVEGWTGYSGYIPNLTNLSTLSRNDIIGIMKYMRAAANTYNIATPDYTYEGYDLVHFDYQTREGHGVTLLTVNAFFREILQSVEAAISNGQVDTDTCMVTSSTQSNVISSSLSDIKNAVGSAEKSIGQEVSSAYSSVSSTVSNLATSAASSFVSTATSVAKQASAGVTSLLSTGVM